MYVLDPDTTTRRWRPWHILDTDLDTGPMLAFATCGKAFDLRPHGLTIEGRVESNDIVCGICLRRNADAGGLTPIEDEVWSSAAAMLREGRIPKDDIAEAMHVYQRWGYIA